MSDKAFWRGKRVLVTGGNGFLGRHVVERLEKSGAVVIAPRRAETNFTSMDATMKCFAAHAPEIVLHSAAFYGGLGITLNEPGKIYYENLVMGAHLMEAARLHKVRKFVSIGTACSYPGHLTDGMKESDLWTGPLHESVVAYGSVKRMLAIQGAAYKKQFGFDSIHLIPSNMYGPFDCFDEYRSHVVGALVRKFCEAHATGGDVTMWGTGSAVREFLFVEDCADGILLAAEKYNDVTPLNLGTGVGTTIRTLAEGIAHALDFRGRMLWDHSKPDGQAVKFLDITKMSAALGWSPRTDLKTGLAKTVAWYNAHLLEAKSTRKAA